MKYGITLLLIILATTLFATMRTATVHAQNQQYTISVALDFWISNCERDVVSAAEAMPEGKYSFAPSAGEFTGVKTFAEQVKHLAANNYRMAARILGQKPTPDQEAETGPGSVRTKAEILDYLKGSFAALHRSAATVTAENAITPVFKERMDTPAQTTQNTRVQFAIDAVTHSYDHYGQLVEYLRMNNIVPPASRKKQAAMQEPDEEQQLALNLPGRQTNSSIIEFVVSEQENRILDIADVMPAEKYNFAPKNGQFKDVRTFGQQLVHIASDNYVLGAGILQQKPPAEVGDGESGDTRLHTKAEIVAYLKESFRYMHKAARTVDESGEVVPTPNISPWPQGTATRMALAVEDCVHTYDHYGQLVEYLRMNGIVPPTSQRKK